MIVRVGCIFIKKLNYSSKSRYFLYIFYILFRFLGSCLYHDLRFQDVYRPQRRYKRHDADKLYDEETRVHSTLLEYGRYFYSGKGYTENCLSWRNIEGHRRIMLQSASHKNINRNILASILGNSVII